MFNRTVAMCGIAAHCKHFELLKSERIELMSSRGEVAITTFHKKSVENYVYSGVMI